jgi:hypothetical protein
MLHTSGDGRPDNLFNRAAERLAWRSASAKDISRLPRLSDGSAAADARGR